MVEAFAEVAAGADDRGWFVARGEFLERSASVGGSQAAVQFGEVRDLGSHLDTIRIIEERAQPACPS